MNEAVLILEGTTGVVIQAQVWTGTSQGINDDIMESDGSTLVQIFFAPFAGPGPGPAVPMAPIAGGPRVYEAIDLRMFDAIDNRIFEA